jgi:hypothetical protein
LKFVCWSLGAENGILASPQKYAPAFVNVMLSMQKIVVHDEKRVKEHSLSLQPRLSFHRTGGLESRLTTSSLIQSSSK